jgi:hypothetical protein
MGVARCDYVMVAARFDLELFDEAAGDKLDEIDDLYSDNSYSEKVTSHNELTIVADGMCGKYLFLGAVYAKATDDGSGFGVIDLDEAEAMRHTVAGQVGEELKTLGLDLPFEVKTYIFTHWH